MARYHGRNGVLLLQLSSASTTLTTLSYVRDWSLNFAVDQVDATALGDSNKVYVAGLPDATGTVSGFHDDAGGDTLAAAQDGVARTFQLYPEGTDTGSLYYSGTALWDFSLSGGVGGVVEFTANWSANSAVTRTAVG
jgi:hypothetical protein